MRAYPKARLIWLQILFLSWGLRALVWISSRFRVFSR